MECQSRTSGERVTDGVTLHAWISESHRGRGDLSVEVCPVAGTEVLCLMPEVRQFRSQIEPQRMSLVPFTKESFMSFDTFVTN